MVSLDFTQHSPNCQTISGPYSIEHGLFLRLLQLPFVAIMLKIKTEILNTNSGDCHILICAICIHVGAWETT